MTAINATPPRLVDRGVVLKARNGAAASESDVKERAKGAVALDGDVKIASPVAASSMVDV